MTDVLAFENPMVELTYEGVKMTIEYKPSGVRKPFVVSHDGVRQSSYKNLSAAVRHLSIYIGTLMRKNGIV